MLHERAILVPYALSQFFDCLYFIVAIMEQRCVGMGGDELADWATDRGGDFFLKPDPKLLTALSTVSAWAAGQSYEPAAVNTFLQVADYYLVAQALVNGDTVVTHEIASSSTKKIKIPDACIALGIKCVTPYEMLRTERARFILGPKP